MNIQCAPVVALMMDLNDFPVPFAVAVVVVVAVAVVVQFAGSFLLGLLS